MEKQLHFFIPVDILKSFSSHEDDPWIFEGVASTGDVDLFGEVVYPESFSQTVDFFKKNGKIYFDHEYAKTTENNWLERYGFTKDEILSLKTPIGKPLDAQIRADGLYIKGVLNKSHPIARKMWQEFLANTDKEFTNQIGLSIGAKYLGTPKREYDVKRGKYITYLPELLLYEVSMTPEPVNPHTWTAVLKSMCAEGATGTVQHQTVNPDKVMFDPTNEKLVMTFRMQDGGGVERVVESYIDIKEGITNIMDDMKVVLKATGEGEKPPVKQEGEEEKTPQGDLPPKEDNTSPQGDPSPAAVDTKGPSLGDAIPSPLDAESAPSLLDSLITEEKKEALPSDSDASIQMLLDKVDTVLDLITQLSEAIHAQKLSDDVPAGGQSTTEPPMTPGVIKSVIRESFDTLTVGLSDDSATSLGQVIRAELEQTVDKIATMVVGKLSEESSVARKSVTSPKESPKIVYPGKRGEPVAERDEQDVVVTDVLKAVSNVEDEKPYDKTVLKSLVSQYRDIIGYTSAHAQRRARVIEEATKTLGVTEPEFKKFVKLADKGKL